jgi:hypothetical protein
MYALAPEREPSRPLRKIITALLALVVLYYAGSWTLGVFGFGNSLHKETALLQTEGGGTVRVSLEGGDWQAAANGMKMYADDKVSTSSSAHAALMLFDGSIVRLDQSTDTTLVDHGSTSDSAVIRLSIAKGSLWVKTPPAGTGSATREILTSAATFSLPSGTEAVVGTHSLAVFSADGNGVQVTVKGYDPIVIGEGQEWQLPTENVGKDLYDYRAALTARSNNSSFLADSRSLFGQGTTSAPSSANLFVTKPTDGSIVTTNLLDIAGTAGSNVASVTVNGQEVPLSLSHEFNTKVSVAETTGDILLTIRALASNGSVLQEVRRTVKRGQDISLDMPTIDSPAKSGETYRTDSNEIIIRGTSPKGAIGIMVNDYTLRLFDPAKGTWSYLATPEAQNLKDGTNVYNVYALYADGAGSVRKSNPVTLTIIHGAGVEGTVSGGTSSAASSSSSKINPATLPNNAPLAAGTLKVTAPEAGTSYTATGTGFLLEGTTSKQTASIWVNDYQLQLYKPGTTTWNYIASTELSNLKPGKNTYRIVARNEEGKILDTVEYVVTYSE